MVASYLDLPILDLYYIIDQKTYMFLLKAFRHIKKVLGLVISRISYPLNNNAVMKEQYLTELENYCHQIPYLGFAPQEYLLICKIAYYAYKAHEDITDQEQHVKEWLRQNRNCQNFTDEAFDRFWDGLQTRIHEVQLIIDCIDRVGLLR